MKITSKDKRSDEILTWADVFAKDDNGLDIRAVRKITFTVEAGDIPTLEVETYNTEGREIVETINSQGIVSPSTNIRTYCVDKISIDARGFDEIKRDKVRAHTKNEEDFIEKLRDKRSSNINPISELEL